MTPSQYNNFIFYYYCEVDRYIYDKILESRSSTSGQQMLKGD